MTAANAIRAKRPASLRDMSDADLADAHRGHCCAKRRAEDALKAIEDELDRREATSARSNVSIATKHVSDLGLLDIKRLRAEHPDLCRRFALPDTGTYWRSRTLTEGERA